MAQPRQLKSPLQTFTVQCQQRLEKLFALYLDKISVPALRKAIQHSVFSPSKNIRPLLVYATGHAISAPVDCLDLPACAIELIHTYSLIHDDLPAMDNANLRRGKPACHKVFGEAMAILAGDALQPLAFDVIAQHPAPPSLTEKNRLQMIHVLSQAGGPYGMVAGQALDITAMQKTIAPDELHTIYRLKTGALLSASVTLATFCVNKINLEIKNNLACFADNLGLAFQIQDDILDMENTGVAIGKPQGLDAANQKITYAAIHGLDTAKKHVDDLFHTALAAITPLGERAELLRELAMMVLKRRQ
ncbi:MAG: hypothetical protein A3E83_05740 [Gammaproteobacteria bacterium RIFCSPHIGHO2_12_FULL_41_20]|nr:MAG: hypothetical protein A3E83_05740 [Gammaproteobacteria bacterium RIFCSPHIGHO2_12_FULL_41_20]